MGAQGGPKIIASNLKFLIDHDDDKCNDNSSVLTDLSGYGNSATMYTGTAMEFTGSQWVQMDEGGIDSTGSYTLCGWAKRKHTGGPPGTIVGQNIDGVTVGFELAWYDDNKLQFWWRDSSYTGRTMGGGSSARPLTAGQWYHLAVTFDTVNGKITTWVNGAEDTSTTSNE